MSKLEQSSNQKLLVASAKMPKPSKRSSDASGQALGYGLQYTRLTHMLLEAERGSHCSLEYLDDVAESSPGGQVRVQAKSALTSNPVADRAKSLWKTFSTWLDDTKEVDLATSATIFEIYVSRQVSGELVKRFHDARNKAEALEAIEAARLKLWGEGPDFTEKGELSPEISGYVNRVLSADDSALSSIIVGFRLVCGSGSPVTDLEALLRTHPIPPSKVRQVLDYLCGAAKTRVDQMLERGEPAIVSRDEFHALYRAFLRKIDSETVLAGYAKKPTREQALRSLPAAFIGQLELIDVDYEDKLQAVNDFLMAAVDRTEWAKAGDVDVSSFDELDDVLSRTWKNRRKALGIQHQALAASNRGELLYRDCLGTRAPLQAMETPHYFIPGCLHRLADDLTIGWHPDYESLMKAGLKKAA